MAKLIYSGISSLDGYIADEDSSFDWAVPDEEVLAFITTISSGRSALTSTDVVCRGC
jgi:hypothetical protein